MERQQSERDMELIKEYIENKTIKSELALMFNISRERVRQIIEKNFTKEEYKKIDSENFILAKASRVSTRHKNKCKNCGKDTFNEYFCNKECYFLSRTIDPEIKKRNHELCVKRYQESHKDQIRDWSRNYMRTYKKLIV